MQHEVLAALALERVDDLLVLAGAERGDAERLRLAAGEQGGAVGARQHADLGDDRADGLGVAAVDAQAGVEDGVADDVGLELLEQRLGRVGVEALGGQRLGGGLLGGADLLLAGLLLRLLVGLGERRRGRARRRGPSAPPAPARARRAVQGSLAACSASSMIAWITGCMCVVAEGDGAEHDLLGQLLRLALDHQHAFGGAGDDEVELAARRAAPAVGLSTYAPST